MTVPYRSTLASRRSALPPDPAPEHERSRRSQRVDRVALAGLGVAALGMTASLAGIILQFRTLDDPYRQLVYAQQVEQAMTVVKEIQAASDDLERWQSVIHERQGNPLTPERRQRLLDFLQLSERMWLLPQATRSAIDLEAHSFSVYVANCAVASYRGDAPPSACHDKWLKLKGSLQSTKDAVLSSVKMKARLQS